MSFASRKFLFPLSFCLKRKNIIIKRSNIKERENHSFTRKFKGRRPSHWFEYVYIFHKSQTFHWKDGKIYYCSHETLQKDWKRKSKRNIKKLQPITNDNVKTLTKKYIKLNQENKQPTTHRSWNRLPKAP